ncbi:hypothetical protein BURMUCF2_A1483 [Burkholderia multivorans CF2]|nr:hypothetical protein BURMUCF2_A1483 [Burkholderia multivorans CF2]
MANGQIPPDVGQDLIQSIKHIASIHEVTELEKRLNELEELIRNFGSM